MPRPVLALAIAVFPAVALGLLFIIGTAASDDGLGGIVGMLVVRWPERRRCRRLAPLCGSYGLQSLNAV